MERGYSGYGTSPRLAALGETSRNLEGRSKQRHHLMTYFGSCIIYTLWIFKIAMENGPFIDDFPIKTSIYKGFSMAMLNNQMVYIYIYLSIYLSGWWLTYPSEKYESQLGLLFPIYGKIKNVPNHQPDIYIYIRTYNGIYWCYINGIYIDGNHTDVFDFLMDILLG